jgi:hypothetical protein
VVRIVCCTALIASLIAIALPASRASDVVEIHLRGHYFAEPATVQITVAVEPDAENRMLRIEADGDRYFRASELTLSGEQDKRLHGIEFKNLPAGNYVLRAEVLSRHAVRGQATQELFVTGSGGR